MIRIAVQSKGRLFEETMSLLQEADIKIPSSKRILLVQSSNFPVEVLFLRDDDIPQSVANGIADLGIVGENEYVERNEDAEIIKRLGFSKCHLSLAIPKDVDYPGLSWFAGRKIATSYPGILKRFLDERGEVGYPCHYRFGRDCSGHRFGGCHLRYRQLGFHIGEQPPEGSGNRDAERGIAHRQQAPFG